MATLTTPGVYVEETPPGPRIERVDTATAAFVGPTRRGPLGVRPRLLHSAADFERLYGGCQPLRFIGGTAHAEPRTHHVAHAVRAFFANGGARLYVARTAFGARPASAVLGEDETPDRRVTLHALDPGSGGNGRVVLRERLLPAGLRAMTEAPPGTLLRTVSAGRPCECLRGHDKRWRDREGQVVARGRVADSRIVALDIEWADADGIADRWGELAWSPSHPRWAGAVLGSAAAQASALPLWLHLGAAVDAWALLDRVRALAGQAVTLAGGTDGMVPPLADEATPGSYAAALAQVALLEDVRTVAAPGASALEERLALQAALVAHAERPGAWRIAVLDAGPDLTADQALAQRQAVDSGRAAFYWPWVVVADPLAPPGRMDAALALPPSGVVAGLYARSDAAQGVHKAPAGLPVAGVLHLAWPVSAGEQDRLNPQGVNCLREFLGRGLLVWGARLADDDPEIRYVHQRRWLDMVEASLGRGLRWVAQEHHGEALWTRVRQAVDGFLQPEWRAGALAGQKPEEAWWVRCDRSTMTQADLDEGRIVCLIGVALVKPAEFVVLRWTGRTADAQQAGG